MLESWHRLYQTGCTVTEGEGESIGAYLDPNPPKQARQANASRSVPTPAGCPFFPMNNNQHLRRQQPAQHDAGARAHSGTLRTSTACVDFAVAAFKDPPVRTGVTQVTVPLNQGAV